MVFVSWLSVSISYTGFQFSWLLLWFCRSNGRWLCGGKAFVVDCPSSVENRSGKYLSCWYLVVYRPGLWINAMSSSWRSGRLLHVVRWFMLNYVPWDCASYSWGVWNTCYWLVWLLLLYVYVLILSLIWLFKAWLLLEPAAFCCNNVSFYNKSWRTGLLLSIVHNSLRLNI